MPARRLAGGLQMLMPTNIAPARHVLCYLCRGLHDRLTGSLFFLYVLYNFHVHLLLLFGPQTISFWMVWSVMCTKPSRYKCYIKTVMSKHGTRFIGGPSRFRLTYFLTCDTRTGSVLVADYLVFHTNVHFYQLTAVSKKGGQSSII